jgi:copper transport protein
VRCSQAREALSAWYDGERAEAAPSAVAGHVAACDRCSAFQRSLGALADLTVADIVTDAAPSDSAPSDLARAGIGWRRLSRPAVRSALRLLVVLAGLGSLVPAVADALGRDHEVHEAFAFTAAVSVALLCAAVRPHLARGYVPVIGVASALLVLTGAVDVDEGRVGFAHESRHLGVLVGFVLLVLLAAGDRPRRLPTTSPGRTRSHSRAAATAAHRLGRSIVPALAAVFVVGTILLAAPPASAHAMLEDSTPAADAVLTTPPTSVDLVFNEAVSLLADSVRVFGPDGARVDDGAVAHADGDPATAGVGVRRDLPDGTYLVSYRVVSADSHPVEGAYTFVIGHPSRGAAAAPPSDGSTPVDVALGFSRWLTYAGSALGLGGFAFLAWCWPGGWSSRRARLLVAGGIVALTAGTLVALLLKGPYDAGAGLGGITDGAQLRAVLGTTYGRAMDARLFLIALLVLLLTYREHLPARWMVAAPGVLLAGTGVTFALCGHAAAGGHRPIAIASDTLHVGAMSLWLGGLALLLGAVLGRGRREESTPPVLRFSRVASLAVTTLVATGVYQSLREVRSWDVLLHSHYGHVLLVKLGIVALVLVAAAGSRAWVWQTMNPVVQVHAATAAPPGPVVEGRPRLRRLRVSVAIETTVLLGVLVASAMLVTSDPAASTPTAHPVSESLVVGPDRVRVSAVPDAARHVRVTLDVTDADGKPTEPREVDASLSLPASRIGPLPITLVTGGQGHRTGAVSVPVPGDWRLAVTVRTSAIDEATGYVDVPVS